jgi:TatD DNase family protein
LASNDPRANAGRKDPPRAGSARWGEARRALPDEGERERPPLIDSHCHLEAKDFRREADGAEVDERDEVVARARQAGVGKLVCIGSGASLVEVDNAIAWAARDPQIWAAIGIHPHDAARMDDTSFAAIAERARGPRVVAVGETGLDYHYDYSPREDQRRVFARFLRLGADVKKPVTLHVRDAHEDARALYASEADRSLGGIVHCFTGTPADAEAWLALGLHISFSGILTFKSATGIQEAARLCPADRILIETDCPYLAPIPHRGKRNEPAFVVHTARKLAELRGVDEAVLAEQTTQNAERLLGI